MLKRRGLKLLKLIGFEYLIFCKVPKYTVFLSSCNISPTHWRRWIGKSADVLTSLVQKLIYVSLANLKNKLLSHGSKINLTNFLLAIVNIMVNVMLEIRKKECGVCKCEFGCGASSISLVSIWKRGFSHSNPNKHTQTQFYPCSQLDSHSEATKMSDLFNLRP
jgi:hypothetical protein